MFVTDKPTVPNADVTSYKISIKDLLLSIDRQIVVTVITSKKLNAMIDIDLITMKNAILFLNIKVCVTLLVGIRLP